MNVLKKITLKNMTKYSLMFFIFGVFPLISLLLFYNPSVGVLGLLFSYISIILTIGLLQSLFFIKEKVVFLSQLISNKINSITDKDVARNVSWGVKGGALILSIAVLYIFFVLGSLFLNFISLISTLNPLMILALNIYYVGISFAFMGEK